MTTAFNFAAAANTSAPTLPTTNRLDARVLAECPAPTGTLLSANFSPGYPVPGTATQPTQEHSAAARRPSGPVTAAECAAINGVGVTVPATGAHDDLARALWGIPLLAAGGTALATFLRRRSEGVTPGD